MSQMKRYSREELAEHKLPLSRDEMLQAREELRQFDSGFAWLVICKALESARTEQEKILYGPVSRLSVQETAYAMGCVQTIDGVYRAFDYIFKEAGKVRE